MRPDKLVRRPLCCWRTQRQFTQLRIQTEVLSSAVKYENACMHAYICLYACYCVFMCRFVHMCPLSQLDTLINSDEWMKIVTRTSLTLSESFHPTPQGILCHVMSPHCSCLSSVPLFHPLISITCLSRVSLSPLCTRKTPPDTHPSHPAYTHTHTHRLEEEWTY